MIDHYRGCKIRQAEFENYIKRLSELNERLEMSGHDLARKIIEMAEQRKSDDNN